MSYFQEMIQSALLKAYESETNKIQQVFIISPNIHIQIINIDLQSPVNYLDKTRQDIYYHYIASTISWQAVSNKNASQGVPY